ncbi:MAG: hypothetical protein H7256_05405 [Bdellovibrio sp.]|nr:hypothetical protein [Bdellovibrio sp.]
MRKNVKANLEQLNESPLKTIGSAKADGSSVKNGTMGCHANVVKKGTMGAMAQAKK